MPSRAEVLGNRSIGGKKALGVSWRLECLHAALTLAHGLVGVFRTIVEVVVLPMFHAREELPLGCSVAFQLIGGEHPRDILAPFEQLAEKFLGSRFTPPMLHQNIQPAGE